MTSFEKWPEVLTPEDVRRALGISKAESLDMFKRPGFPIITPGKRRNKQVGKYALRAWLNRGLAPEVRKNDIA